MLSRILLCALMALPLSVASANDVEIVHTEFKKQGDTWSVSTTLRHGDTGWKHYADQWRVVDEKGKELGKRILMHPHENEQPFTRSQSGIKIHSNANTVYVEAHDKVHGWSEKRVRVDLSRSQGKRFSVSR